MLNEYEQQANNFCRKHNATIVFDLIAVFADPNLKPYIGEYRSGKTERVLMKRCKYLCTINRGEKKETFEFTNSAFHEIRPIRGQWMKKREPTAYDILACLQDHDPGDFEEFCCDYGYNTDSKKHTETYLAVRTEYSKVLRLFHDVMEELREIT